MAPVKNVLDIREVAERELDATPIVTESNRWIFVETVHDVDLAELSEELNAKGYRAKVLGNKLKATKPDLHWPET